MGSHGLVRNGEVTEQTYLYYFLEVTVEHYKSSTLNVKIYIKSTHARFDATATRHADY